MTRDSNQQPMTDIEKLQSATSILIAEVRKANDRLDKIEEIAKDYIKRFGEPSVNCPHCGKRLGRPMVRPSKCPACEKPLLREEGPTG